LSLLCGEKPRVIKHRLARYATLNQLDVVHWQAFGFSKIWIEVDGQIYMYEKVDDFLGSNWKSGAGVNWKHLRKYVPKPRIVKQ
jgi:hypothetical protein